MKLLSYFGNATVSKLRLSEAPKEEQYFMTIGIVDLLNRKIGFQLNLQDYMNYMYIIIIILRQNRLS